ncbi:hypothetical protein SBA4_1740016 [Candidatus Sulfopaludibacter sp. SbA4]|nr:hypothetical protein SBA4_1740016 [Candidatus Sulfopaludibacter sp. SbA4]
MVFGYLFQPPCGTLSLLLKNSEPKTDK